MILLYLGLFHLKAVKRWVAQYYLCKPAPYDFSDWFVCPFPLKNSLSFGVSWSCSSNLSNVPKVSCQDFKQWFIFPLLEGRPAGALPGLPLGWPGGSFNASRGICALVVPWDALPSASSHPEITGTLGPRWWLEEHQEPHVHQPTAASYMACRISSQVSLAEAFSSISFTKPELNWRMLDKKVLS